MKRIITMSALFIVALLMLTACNTSQTTDNKNESPQTAEQTKHYPLKIKDATGHTVEIKEEPQKIVSLIPSNTETLAALGVEKKLIGVSDLDDYPASVKTIDKIGGMEFNIEKIISMKPDLVFAHETMAKSSQTGMQQLRDLGIPIFVVQEARNFIETYDTIMEMGVIMNRTTKAKAIVDEMTAKVEDIQKKVESVNSQRSAFIETSDEPEIYTAGHDTFVQEMFDLLSIKNSATKSGWYQISSEAIIKSDPDVILIMHDSVPGIIEQVKKRHGFQTISAVKNNRVVQINADTISRTSPRLVDGLEEIAKAVYPEAFKK
ncbi:ABC transporter substrate-binding protein [Kurthia sibirica]|nr:ABC transporter substrate-binding protein [Kurthia sibirica]GEK33220.1 putative ABC transporter substrate-binding lipoprotein YvrC [Kurthia sibirica]